MRITVIVLFAGVSAWSPGFAQFQESESEQVFESESAPATEIETDSKSLYDHVSFAPRLTYLTQGSTDGDIDYQHGGKFDVTMKVDLHSLGWWQGANFIMKGEANYGHSINNDTGLLMPVNLAMLYPGEEGSDRYDITSWYFQKRVGSSSALLFGKMNMLDFTIRRGSGGAGIDYFWNVGLVAPPSGLIPPQIFGALLVGKTKSFQYTVGLYDANGTENKSGLEDPFEDGANVALIVDFPVTIGGQRGYQGFKVAYSTKDEPDLSEISLPPAGGGFGNTKNRWYAAYTFKNYIRENTNVQDGGWGVFGQVGISENPNGLDFSWALGIGGNSLTKARPEDRWGFGYFHFSVTDEIVDGLGGLGIPLQDERGFEIFYNAQVTPWLNVTADVQFIDPVSRNQDNVTLFGLRASTNFDF
ncbi:MAG: carbohydrate porin [Woeseiaceae bacterium]